MPDIARPSLRMDCTGIDLVHPLDRMPPGSFGYLFNVRVLQEGRLEGRPGYTSLISLSDAPNSIRRLNDPSKLRSPQGYAYVGGGGSNLYVGDELSYAPLDSGYSGDPLSLIPFRPDQSPDSWMYIYDRDKQSKVRSDGEIRDIGVAPPASAPVIDYGIPAQVTIDDGQATTGWAATGVSTAVGLYDRPNSTAPTIANILYNSGTTGWCCIHPVISDPSWMGERMKVLLLGGFETAVVREIHGQISSTTIDSIQYDSGNTGPCSMVLVGSPTGMARNSLIVISGELIRVLEVVPSPTGVGYSIRCSTTATHAAADLVDGAVSWYVYTTINHVAGETIQAGYVKFTHPGAGVGSGTLTSGVDASLAGGRPVDPANDYMHISIFLENPSLITDIQFLLSLDGTPNFSFSNPGNSYIWKVNQADLILRGSIGGSWGEIVIPISSATRTGSDLTRTLANISGIAIQMNSTGACDYGFDWWYLFGTYGSVVQPNSPVGTVYQSRFRDSSTGAHSVPGPQTRYQIYPLRESVIITPLTSSQAGIDSIDIYRDGASVTSPLYSGSLVNNNASPNSYTDDLPDSAVLKLNQPPDLQSLQPWPILDVPWSGTALVVGTSVIGLTGTPFNTSLLSNSVISIDGVSFQTYGQPRSSTFLELTQDAGSIAVANWQISSPTLAGQPLPFAFGSLEGPFAPVIFGLGDSRNGGLLYFTAYSDADSASDSNTLEISTPSSDLISGAVWNGMAFSGTRDTVLCIRYSYLTSIGAGGSASFQWVKVSGVPSGMWSRWSCCSCPLGVAFLGRDGIYIATDSGGVNITDEKLYPLFPHDGSPAEAVNSGSNVILPVDMSQLQYLRLTYCDESIRFAYKDTGGNFNTLIYEIYKKRWLLNNYGDQINLHYLVEADSFDPNKQEILQMAVDTQSFMLAGGNTDNGGIINSLVLSPSMDGGDQRSQKLHVDCMTQADGNGVLSMAATYDNAQSFSPVVDIACTGSIQQAIQNLASLSDLSLHRNVGVKFAWSGGPDGPRVYAWEASSFLQPYLSTFFVTQFIMFSFPGWKHMRRMFPALISNHECLFTIKTQDGRAYGPYVIPSTGGQYRILPQMLDSGIKDLAFALQVDGQGSPMALFPSDFTVEVKQWTEENYINLAVFKS